MFKVKVQKLTESAFAPYGDVLGTEGKIPGGEQGLYNWYEKLACVTGADSVSINLLTAMEREFICRRFEMHQRTTETVLPLTGGLIVAVLPKGDVAFCKLAAFYVPIGKGVSFAPGVWHYAPYPIGGDATCAVIFRDNTGKDDVIFAELDEDAGFTLT